MTVRNYSNIAVATTLSVGIGTGDVSVHVVSATGYPVVPFAIIVDVGTVSEEVMLVTNKVGTTFTVTRAYDGTTASAHSLGASVIHGAIADDLRQFVQSVNGQLGVVVLGANDVGAYTTAQIATILSAYLLISSYDYSTLPNKPAFGSLALLNSVTAALISDASANGRSILTAVNYAAMRTLLSLVVGTDVAAINSPTFINTPSAPTAALGTNTTQLATTAFVLANGAGVTDGDKGDITVSGSGAVWTIDNDVVTYTKMQNVSVTARILGRTTAGAGDVEELTGAQALAITGAGQAPTVNVFTSTTLAWLIPAGVTQFYMEVIGGGGGGGSGRRGTAGSARGGGGGGGSGGRSWGYIRKSDLGSATTLDITIGAGGAGGAAQTANDTNGSTGSAGGSTSIAITSGATLMQATAGAANNAGTTTAGGAGGSIGGSQDIGNQGGTGGLGAGAGNGNQNTTTYAGGVPGGGGGGGGISTGNAIDNGGTGGIVRSTILTGATGGASPGGAGVNGTASPVVVGPGGGGSGGASSITGVAGSGGVGGNYGAGGGGGGASLNGNNSGAGGAGAQGVALIICW